MKQNLLKSIIFSVIVIVCIYNATFANETDLKEDWCISELSLGRLTSQGCFSPVNPANAADSECVYVDNCDRTLRGKTYYKRINTGGSASYYSQYVPKKRAVSVTISRPAYLSIIINTSSSSSDANVAYVSSDLGLVKVLSINTGIKKYVIYLASAGTYYVSGPNGAIGIFDMSVYNIVGDVDYDGEITDYDLAKLYQIVYNEELKEEYSEYSADINFDGNIDKKDINILKNKIKNEYPGIPECYSYKEWNIGSVFSDYSPIYDIENGGTYDGLTIIPPKDGTLEPHIFYQDETKWYGDLQFTGFINTEGDTALDSDSIPLERALSFCTSCPTRMTLYVRCGTTDKDATPGLAVSRRGEVVANRSILNVSQQGNKYAQKVEINLDRPDKYYIYSTDDSLKIYGIFLMPTELPEIAEKNLSVTKGLTYEVLLIGNGISPTEDDVYIVEYSPEVVSADSLGIGSDINGSDFTYSDDLTVLEKTDGHIVFKTNLNESNWNGVVSMFKFTALDSGTVNIKFER